MKNEEATDPKDQRIAELENQVKSMESFSSALMAQRNEALNQAAQYLGQLTTIAGVTK